MGITLKSFSNFRPATVQDVKLLKDALAEIGGMAGRPHFTTKAGHAFGFEEIHEALVCFSANRCKNH